MKMSPRGTVQLQGDDDRQHARVHLERRAERAGLFHSDRARRQQRRVLGGHQHQSEHLHVVRPSAGQLLGACLCAQLLRLGRELRTALLQLKDHGPPEGGPYDCWSGPREGRCDCADCRQSLASSTMKYGETGSRSFDLPCGAIRRLVTATMIADRDQRLLELSADGQASRVRAADTSARGHDPCRHKPHLRALAGTVPSSGGPKRPPLPT